MSSPECRSGGAGARPPYSEDARAAALRASGLFPDAAPSVQQQLLNIKKRVDKTTELNVFRKRRLLRQEQYNSKLELDRLESGLREQRVPALRGENARVAGLRRTIEELNSQLQ